MRWIRYNIIKWPQSCRLGMKIDICLFVNKVDALINDFFTDWQSHLGWWSGGFWKVLGADNRQFRPSLNIQRGHQTLTNLHRLLFLLEMPLILFTVFRISSQASTRLIQIPYRRKTLKWWLVSWLGRLRLLRWRALFKNQILESFIQVSGSDWCLWLLFDYASNHFVNFRKFLGLLLL